MKLKENPYYIKYKEMKKDPKLKPIISLVFWFIFIVFATIFVKSNSVSSNKAVSKISSNYEYTYKDNSKTIFGYANDNYQEFILDNNKYFTDGNNVYLINENSASQISNFDMGILKITPSFINNLTNNLSYTNGLNYKQYAVLLSNFISLYDNDTDIDLSLYNQYNIIIQVYSKNNDIYMYKLDLSNYYKLKGINDNGILTINIYNTSNDFVSYYKNLIGVVK